MFDCKNNFVNCEGNKIQGKTWTEVEEQILDSINYCCSVRQLKNSRFIYTSLIENISQSRLFVRYERNNNITKISISLLDEEFMYFLCNENLLAVSESELSELLSELLQELCEKAIECIDRRIHVIEERNRLLRKREEREAIICAILCVTLPFIIAIVKETIGNDIVRCILDVFLRIVLVTAAIKAFLNPLRWFMRENDMTLGGRDFYDKS